MKKYILILVLFISSSFIQNQEDEINALFAQKKYQECANFLNNLSKENNYVHNTLTINYLSKNKLKNSTSIRQIYIDNDGSLSDEFGSGFLDETELIIRNILNSRK